MMDMRRQQQFLFLPPSSRPWPVLLMTMAFLGGQFSWFKIAPTVAQTNQICTGGILLPSQGTFKNTASAVFTDQGSQDVRRTLSPPVDINFTSTRSIAQDQNSPLRLVSQGVTNAQGNTIPNLGAIVNALTALLVQQGLDISTAKTASMAMLNTYVSQRPDLPVAAVWNAIHAGLQRDYPGQWPKLSRLNGVDVVMILAVADQTSLTSLGLSGTQAAAVDAAVRPKAAQFLNQALPPFNTVIADLQQQVLGRIADAPLRNTIAAQFALISGELGRIRASRGTSLQPGDLVLFNFTLTNRSSDPQPLQLPNVAELNRTSLNGGGTVASLKYTRAGQSKTITTTGENLTLAVGESLPLVVSVRLGNFSANQSTELRLNLGGECGTSREEQVLTLVAPNPTPLRDPFGQVTSCDGGLLPDYTGFKVGLYDPIPGTVTGEVANPTVLTQTELPDNPTNSIPQGIRPNTENSNPFFLTNADQGEYSFLFDQDRAQAVVGRKYIIVISPPPSSRYQERRIQIAITENDGTKVKYTATSLDGLPISLFVRPVNETVDAQDSRKIINGELNISDADTKGLRIFTIAFPAIGIPLDCNSQKIAIVKSASQASAEPGDTVIYRLNVRSLDNSPLTNVTVTDTLPVGFNLLPDSVRAEIAGAVLKLTPTVAGRSMTVVLPNGTLGKPNDTANIVYAAQLTPDALRGNGVNVATVNGTRVDNSKVSDTANYRLRLRSGILSDLGTIIGKVFVDKNFDGEQQPGEAGIPNAVVYMEDGNRILTDAEGMFSVTNVPTGYHVGTLDSVSLPGYTYAPNLFFSGGNSPSRMVHLEPGGMVRMLFPVTPTFNEQAGN